MVPSEAVVSSQESPGEFAFIDCLACPVGLEGGVDLLAVAVDGLDVAELVVVLEVDVERDLEQLLQVLLARRRRRVLKWRERSVALHAQFRFRFLSFQRRILSIVSLSDTQCILQHKRLSKLS